MTLATQLTAAFQRVGAEFKSVRTALGLKADKSAIVPYTALVPEINGSMPVTGITAYTTAAAAYQRQYFLPVDVGPVGWTASAIIISLTTVYSGTTIPTAFVGLYGTDVTNGYPDTTQLLGSGSISLSGQAVGMKAVNFATPVALSPGRYWLSFLLAGSAVSTAGAFTSVSGTALNYPLKSATTLATNLRSIFLDSQTALKTTSTSTFLINGSTDTTLMSLRRSA